VSSSGVEIASWHARGRSWAGPPTPGTQRSLVSSWSVTQGACQAPAWAAAAAGADQVPARHAAAFWRVPGG
jgi:hypothetical protein